jgi:hypothetical protein
MLPHIASASDSHRIAWSHNDRDHFTRREFNQDTSSAKKAGAQGPVFITDRGRPAHVLLTIEDYLRLTGGHMSLAEAFAQPGAGFEFDPPRIGGGIARPADLG